PALAQFQLRDRRMRNARMFDADPPRTAVGVRPDDPDVAAEIDEPMTNSCVTRGAHRAIGGILLADAAEVDLHAGVERNGFARASHPVPADARQHLVYTRSLRHDARLEIPHRTQHAGRDVEETGALPPAGIGAVAQRR